jgi:hypothetical protein
MGLRLIQLPLTYWKKSWPGWTAVSKLAGSMPLLRGGSAARADKTAKIERMRINARRGIWHLLMERDEAH